MMQKLILLVCTVSVVLFVVVPSFNSGAIAGKGQAKSKNQDEDQNQNDQTQNHDAGVETSLKLKSKKASLIWEKALRKHEGNTKLLDSLAEELEVVDEKLMQLKKLKFDHDDPYGDAENIVEKRIQVLLETYGLKRKMQSTEDSPSNRVENKLKNEDKYERIYLKAQQLGFSDAELNDLKNEIFHHKLKMAELDDLVGNLKVMKENMRVGSNVVDEKVAEDHKDTIVSPRKIMELQTAIKEKQKEVDNGLSRLGLMSDSPGLADDATFTQAKVLRLWMGILKSNFTHEERESMKEELMHLEQKMNKRDKLNEEKAILEKHENGLDPAHVSKKEKYAQQREKFEEKSELLDRHVKKYARDINDRIYARRQHIEL